MRASGVVDGAIAGAVGSAALNVVSYLDVAVRARPTSSTPEETVGRIAGLAHVDLGPGDPAGHRPPGPLVLFLSSRGCEGWSGLWGLLP
ncbi:hypothetical protein ACFT9M_16400, partial [Micromonospora purpureochromogenes]